MSGAEIVSMNENRRRRNPFAGTGRHRFRRTAEEWAELEAKCVRLERDRDHAKGEAEDLRTVIDLMREDMRSLRTEVKQMRALMAADPGEQKVTILPPVEDPEKTQPIAAGELFTDGDPMAPLRPKIRIGTIGSPSPSAPPVVLVQPSEMVQHVDATQPIPLWDSPLGQGWRAQRHTA